MRPTVGERIEHIDDAINSIREAVSGQTKASFSDNHMVQLAVDPGILWDMVEKDLEPLKIFVKRIAGS